MLESAVSVSALDKSAIDAVVFKVPPLRVREPSVRLLESAMLKVASEETRKALEDALLS